MIRLFSRRLSSALNILPVPVPAPAFIPPYKPDTKRNQVYTEYDEEKTITNGDDGYRVLVDVCHETQTVYIDHDMSSYDELNDLPRIIKTFGCLYPKYTLRQ
jgi:hypothetical protein